MLTESKTEALIKELFLANINLIVEELYTSDDDELHEFFFNLFGNSNVLRLVIKILKEDSIKQLIKSSFNYPEYLFIINYLITHKK
jgi:hypothetical protein